MQDILYGRQPVRETLRANRRKFIELNISQTLKPSDEINEIISIAQKNKIPVNKVERTVLDKMTNSANHQGILIKLSAYPYTHIRDFITYSIKEKKDPFVLVLDHLQDPQNVGSILRTAEAAGVDGVIIPKDRAVGITSAVVRASAGAAEHISVSMVTNLVQTMKLLKDEGIWFTGMEALPEAKLYTEMDLKGPMGLVIGSEGSGMGRLVGENCDFLMKLPLLGRVSSLNAGSAAAIAIYEIVRQRTQVL